MVCCVLLTWGMGHLLRLIGLGGLGPQARPLQGLSWPAPATWPPRPLTATSGESRAGAGRAIVGWSTVLLVPIEIGAAYLVGEALLRASRSAETHGTAGMAGMSGHMMHDVVASAGTRVVLTPIVLVIALALVCAVFTRALIVRLLPRPRSAGAAVAAGATLIAVSPSMTRHAQTSHAVAMLRIELVAVVIPICALFAIGHKAHVLRRGAAAIGPMLVLLGGIGLPAVLFVLHLPANHERLMSSNSLVFVGLGALALTALALWAIVFDSLWEFSTATKLAALTLVFESVGLLGLALIVVHEPLYGPDMGIGGFGALTDQRLAGIVMMMVDAVVVVPVLKTIVGERSVPTVTGGQRGHGARTAGRSRLRRLVAAASSTGPGPWVRSNTPTSLSHPRQGGGLREASPQRIAPRVRSEPSVLRVWSNGRSSDD